MTEYEREHLVLQLLKAAQGAGGITHSHEYVHAFKQGARAAIDAIGRDKP
jgi:hypothetical protein